MEEYLKTTIGKLKANKYAALNLVLCNESCDLDSAVSAVVYAAYLNWQHQRIKYRKVCTRSHRDESTYTDDIFIPILNVGRQDFVLKTEVVYCLAEAGITADDLVFRDDFNLEELTKNTNTKVTIVDHHVLSKNDKFLTPCVTEIIDHRPIDKTQWRYNDDTRTTIEIVGSCATLIAQRIKDLSTLFAKEMDFFQEYKQCCDMLHSTIILDTVNFSKEVNKGTPHDEEIVEFLENILKLDDVLAGRQRKLQALLSARSDVSRLSAGDLLRKDVKTIADILVPSFPILVKEFLTRESSSEAVSEALSCSGCSIVVLLGMDLSGGLRRDVAVWGEDLQRVSKFCNLIENLQPSLDLLEDKLADKSANKLVGLRYYIQRNLGASRKQYVPAVIKFLKDQ